MNYDEKYYIYRYEFVVEGGGYQVGRGDWPTQAPIVSPGFDTPEEAWAWFDVHFYDTDDMEVVR